MRRGRVFGCVMKLDIHRKEAGSENCQAKQYHDSESNTYHFGEEWPHFDSRVPPSLRGGPGRGQEYGHITRKARQLS